jgi:hypothetical protein
MTVTYIRWKDACSVEAMASEEYPAKPELSELMTVGFLLAEDESAVLVGMELQADDTAPGRYRFNIPKVLIIERRDVEVEKAFTARRRKKS